MSMTAHADVTPTVSRRFDDGTIVELLYNGGTGTTALAVADRGGRVEVVEHFDAPTGERLMPYSATNNLLTSGCILLPSSALPEGEVGDVGDLVADIRAYLTRYVALTPEFEALVPYYVLLTWVFDAFSELPYLRFLGAAGSGKTRRLLAIGSICYKPFFASGASTVSPLFHVLDAFGGTLILDEADFRFSDATNELTKILNNGTVKGLPVLRTMTNRHRELNPQAFSVFGPKIVAMREPFADDGLESRFVTESSSNVPVPSHIPLHTPPEMHVEALHLRNRLLAWRFARLAGTKTKPERRLSDTSARRNQMALSLLSMIDDEQELQQISAILGSIGDPLSDGARRETTERLVRAVYQSFCDHPSTSVPLSAIVEVFNTLSPSADALSPKKVGWMVRTWLSIETQKSRGVSVIPQWERGHIGALAKRFGIDIEMSLDAVQS